MDLLRTLKQIGLSEKQATVYTALLTAGETTMTDLAKKANLKRPTTYLIAEELELLGLASFITKGKKRIISPIHPKRIVEITKFRQDQAEEALPILLGLYDQSDVKPKIQMIEGMEAVRSVYRSIFESLNNKEEGLWFSKISTVVDEFPEILIEYKKILRQLRNPKIRELIYEDEGGVRWTSEMQAHLAGPEHKIRTISATWPFGETDGIIFGNKVVFFSLKKDIFVTLIESAEIAKTMKALFEWAWRQGKEVK